MEESVEGLDDLAGPFTWNCVSHFRRGLNLAYGGVRVKCFVILQPDPGLSGTTICWDGEKTADSPKKSSKTHRCETVCVRTGSVVETSC